MSYTHPDEKFDGTFRQLFNIIEQSVDINASTDLLQTLLEEKLDQLALGLDVFGEPSATARNKITPDKTFIVDNQSIIITSTEKNSIIQLAQQLNLNELNAALIYTTYQLKSINNQNSLFSAFTSAYFQERLFFLASLSSLLSLCNTVTVNEEKTNNTVASIAQSTVASLLKKKSDFLEKLLEQYAQLVRHTIPQSFSKTIYLNRSYAIQNLKEQKKLLEIMVLLVLKEPCDGELIFKFYQEFEANGFGTRFSFDYALDTIEGEKLRTQVTQLCIVLAIQLLQAPILAESNISILSLEKINQIMLFLGDQQVHSLPLLAWARYLRSTIVLSTNSGDNAILNGTQQINTSLLNSSRVKSTRYLDTVHRQQSIEQGPNMDQRYTGRALKLDCFEFLNTLLANSDLNNDGYTYVYHQTIFDLLQGFTSTINLFFLPNDVYKSLLSCYNTLLQHEPLLCRAFWEAHCANPTLSLLTTVQNRFPYNLLDLVQLLSSLIGTSDDNNYNSSVQQVFDYATLAPGLTISLEPSDISKTTTIDDIHIKITDPINIFNTCTYANVEISELVIQPSTKGVVISQDNQNQVVDWQYSYSILHYLAHLLISSIQQKNDGLKNNSNNSKSRNIDNYEVQVILQLFEKLLNSAPTTLINHIETLKTDQHIKPEEKHVSLLMSILCDILLTTSTTNTSLLASALRCLTALIPHYSDFIWSFVFTSNIFPNRTPVYFDMEENSIPLINIIRKVERITEKYQLLLSLLDFISSLLDSLKYNYEKGGDHLKSIYAFLKYILEDVLPSYLDWSYKNVYEKYLIGTKIMAIFIHIERYFTNQDCFINLRQDVLNKFLNDHGDYAITPLLDTMAYNASRLNKLHADGYSKIARQAEQLTKSTFVFIKSLLLNQQLIAQQEHQKSIDQKIKHIEGSVLERKLLEHISSHSHKTDFLLALAQWINYKYDPDLPILATNIISALCISVSKWKMVPNFVQYLGDKSQAQGVIKNYIEIAKDVTRSEQLLTAVWQMITILLESQPSLALLFMECGDTIMPSPKTAVRLLDHSNINTSQVGEQPQKPPVSSSLSTTSSTIANIGGNQSGESALRAAVDILNNWQSLSLNKPSVLSNVLRFLAAFWQTAFDHYALVQRTRSDNALWQAVEGILFNQFNTNVVEDEIVPNFDFLFKNGNYNFSTLMKEMEKQHGNSIHLLRQQCCMRISRAYLMRLISFEIQLTFGSSKLEKCNKVNIGDKLPTGLKIIITKLNDKLSWMQTNIVKNDYNPQLGKELHQLAEQLNLPLCKMKHIGWNDDINNTDGRQYGSSYIYDLHSSIIHIIDDFKLVEYKHGIREEDNIDKLVITPQVQAVRQRRQKYSQFLTKLYSANFNYSLADSDMVSLQAFKTMLEAISSHVGQSLWKNTNSNQKLTLYSFLRGLIEHLLKITANNEQQNGVIWKTYQETIVLIRALIEDYMNGECVHNDFTKNLLVLIPNICLLLDRGQYFALLFNDSKGQMYIDRACFESILLCLRLLPSDTKLDNITDTEMKANLINSLSTLLNALCKKLLNVTQTLATKNSKKIQTKVENDEDNEEEEEFVKYVTVILALMGELIQCEFVDINDWLSTFERNDAIPLLLQLISHGIRILVDEMNSQNQADNNKLHNIIISPYAENAFYLLITLSNIPQSTLILQQHDVMHLLCNNRLSKQLQQGTLDIFVRFHSGTLDTFVERNPLHHVWCQMLQVVSNMVRSTVSLDYNRIDDILRKSALFIQKYGNQVDRSFSIANGQNDRRQHGLAPSESLSTALLLELELLTNIFFGLSKYLNSMKSYASGIFVAFKNSGLPLIQRYHYFLTHPTHTEAQLFPINQEELRQSTVIENGAGEEDEKYSLLMKHVTEKTLLILGNILGAMVILTDAETVLLEEDMRKWPFGNTILQPQSTTSSSEGISFGVITEFIETSLHLISIRRSDSQEDIDIILNSVEQSIILLTTQIVLWVAKPGLDQEQRNIVASNHLKSLINLLDKIKTSLKKWEDEKQGNIKLMMILRTQVIDPLTVYIISKYFQSNN